MDLDAAIHYMLRAIEKTLEEDDCFLCDNEGTFICDNCSLNPENKKTNYYSHRNMPFAPEEFDGWCKYACSKSKAVCCKDCGKYDTCSQNDKCSECEFKDCPNYVINLNKSVNSDEKT